MRYATFSLYCFMLLLSNLASTQTTVHVPDDYPTIQEALDGAEEYDTVLVAPGTYYENLRWPYSKDLHLVSEAGPESTIIDGSDTMRVLTILALTELSLLQGFTIQNGRSSDDGAGIFANYCSIPLKNLILRNNTIEGSFGGGASLKSFKGTIDSCQFINNYASNNFPRGVGLFLECSDDIEINECDFKDNTADYNSKTDGGAIYIRSSISSSDITPLVNIKNCNFLNNKLFEESSGGAVYIHGSADNIEVIIDSCGFIGNESLSRGGAIHVHAADLRISNSTFEKNSSGFGSALSNRSIDTTSFISINKCKFKMNSATGFFPSAIHLFLNSSNFTMVNSEITQNAGRPLHGENWQGLHPLTLINTTIANNELPTLFHNINLSISQSILWNNGETEIDFSGGGNIQISNSLIKGGYPGDNIIDSDPLFISEDNLIPSENSPCLNAGDPFLNVSDDLLGNPRPMPIGTNPDIGAYEVNQDIETSITEQSTKKFRVFPNPTQDWLFFSENIDQISIYNHLGQLLKSEHYTTAINVKDLPEGSYTLILSKDQKEQVETVIVVR